VDRSDASALADLQMHWDEAYTIGLDGDIWSATFHGSADELRAHTSSELRELIRADYAYRQHARRVRTARTELSGDGRDGSGSDRSGGGNGPDRGGAGFGSPGLADDDLDDDDYAAHLDRAEANDGRRDEAEPGRRDGLSGAASPQASYANLRGERMST